AKVLDAATAILVEAGPRAVTVDAVAERSGVAKSTLYRHWSSRQDLLVDVMRCNVPDVEPPAAHLSFADALRQLVRNLAEVLRDPEWRAIMPAMVSLQQHLPELADVFHDDQHEKFEILADVLARGADEGAIPADVDTELAAHVLIGPLVFAVLSGRDGIDDVVDYTVDRFLASYG
ncbi:MAG: TetR/AcrR family transcriptional regulator, partial [Acidimicrobiia bacterium]